MGPPAEALAAAADLVGVLCGPLGTGERSALLEAAGRLLETAPRRRPPVLADCLPLLEGHSEGQALATRLRPWVGGEAGRFFSSPGRGPEVQAVLVVGLRNLPEAWLQAATLLISSWLWQWVKDRPGEKQIIVDEAGLLAAQPALQQLMERLARRVRKYQGSLMLMTQTGADLTATHFGEVMVVNSATHLLGSQSEAGARRLQDALGLDDRDRIFLQQAARGEFLLVCGLQRIPILVKSPPLYHRWLTGDTSKLERPANPATARLPAPRPA
jgi:type IV secretory pathway VirB4 component